MSRALIILDSQRSRDKAIGWVKSESMRFHPLLRSQGEAGGILSMGLNSCPHCGCELLSHDGRKPRSVDQLRRYFAIVRAAFLHWPEANERQFANAEELRAYLQMKAGHREVGAQIPLTGINKERAMLLAEAAIRGAGSYAMPIIHGDTLVIFKPKSIRFSALGHQAFCALNSDIDAIIEAEVGVPAEKLLNETENSA